MTVYQLPELTAEIEKKIQSALSEAAGFFRQEIAAGVSRLFCFESDGGEYYAIIRADGSEMVVAVLAGSGCGSQQVTDYIYCMAQGGGFEDIRFHTRREGLSRLLKKFSPVYAETIFKIKVG